MSPLCPRAAAAVAAVVAAAAAAAPGRNRSLSHILLDLPPSFLPVSDRLQVNHSGAHTPRYSNSSSCAAGVSSCAAPAAVSRDYAGHVQQGPPQGAPISALQLSSKGVPQGAPQSSSRGAPQGAPQGASKVAPQGVSLEASEGVPQGASEGGPQGALEGGPEGGPPEGVHRKRTVFLQDNYPPPKLSFLVGSEKPRSSGWNSPSNQRQLAHAVRNAFYSYSLYDSLSTKLYIHRKGQKRFIADLHRAGAFDLDVHPDEFKEWPWMKALAQSYLRKALGFRV